MTMTDFAAKYGLIFMFAALVYFLPCIIAAARGARHGLGIAILNLFLGWTVLGWLAALIWAAIAPNGPRQGAGQKMRRVPLPYAQYDCPRGHLTRMVPTIQDPDPQFCDCGTLMEFRGFTKSAIDFIPKNVGARGAAKIGNGAA